MTAVQDDLSALLRRLAVSTQGTDMRLEGHPIEVRETVIHFLNPLSPPVVALAQGECSLLSVQHSRDIEAAIYNASVF